MISREILDVAPWTEWVPLISADPPPSPGVYLARQGEDGPVVYVGVGAGARQGGGLRGRLRRYTSGKALASGLGEGIFDRALANRERLSERLAEVESGRPMQAVQWSKASLAWADLHVCWALTKDNKEALALEKRVLAVQGIGWWNRAHHGGY